MGTLIRSALLVKFNEVSREVGVDALDMFRHVGVDLQCLAGTELRVPDRWLLNILDATEQRTGFAAAGLAISRQWRMTDHGPLTLLLQYQATARHALHQFEVYRHMRSDTVTWRLHESGELAFLRLEIQSERGHPGRHGVELTVGNILVLLRWFLGADWSPRQVRFTHAAPRNLDMHLRVFGCASEFGCESDGIVMDRADLDRPGPHRDINLARYARELLDCQHPRVPEVTTLAVQRHLEVLLPQGRCALVDVAAQLGTSARTLQRRLAEERTEFSIVANQVRRSLATRYLRDHRYQISQIAMLVGFSEPSAFSRWFTTHFGQTPRQWRIETLAQERATASEAFATPA